MENLPDGIHALHQDKETVHDTYLSPAQAAKALDNKVEFKYIERYVNIEWLLHKVHSSLSRTLTTLWLLTSNGDLTTPKVIKWQW